MARLSDFHNWLHDVWERQDGVKDDNVDITTGVTTRFPGGVDGHQAGYEGIRQATSRADDRRGVSGRPRRRCFWSQRGGRESTAPVMKTGSVGNV